MITPDDIPAIIAAANTSPLLNALSEFSSSSDAAVVVLPLTCPVAVGCVICPANAVVVLPLTCLTIPVGSNAAREVDFFVDAAVAMVFVLADGGRTDIFLDDANLEVGTDVCADVEVLMTFDVLEVTDGLVFIDAEADNGMVAVVEDMVKALAECV